MRMRIEEWKNSRRMKEEKQTQGSVVVIVECEEGVRVTVMNASWRGKKGRG